MASGWFGAWCTHAHTCTRAVQAAAARLLHRPGAAIGGAGCGSSQRRARGLCIAGHSHCCECVAGRCCCVGWRRGHVMLLLAVHRRVGRHLGLDEVECGAAAVVLQVLRVAMACVWACVAASCARARDGPGAPPSRTPSRTRRRAGGRGSTAAGVGIHSAVGPPPRIVVCVGHVNVSREMLLLLARHPCGCAPHSRNLRREHVLLL